MDMYVNSMEGFVKGVRMVAGQWDARITPWFRGESREFVEPLLPSLFRARSDFQKLHEGQIVQNFRRMAPAYMHVPDIHATDQWLFLMQHLRVPTRLLDWTEGALLALYFALQYPQPVVWMLNPHELNQRSVPSQKLIPGRYPLTWSGDNNIGYLNVRGAWEDNRVGTLLPVAIKPTYVHTRMAAQKSCFTIFGMRQQPMPEMVPDPILVRLVVRKKAIPGLQRDLKVLGVTHTTVFPEAEHLAKEIAEIGLFEPTYEALTAGASAVSFPAADAVKEGQLETKSAPAAESEGI